MRLKSKRSLLTVAFGLILAIILTLTGCAYDDDDEDKIVNNAPIINELIVPDEVNAGESVEFKVIAHDEDGDALTYTWEVKEGELSSSTTQAVTWTPPFPGDPVVVKVKVSDGMNAPTTQSKKVTVNSIFIIPDKQAAGIKLGISFSKVKEIRGEPDYSKEEAFYYLDGVVVFVNDNNIVFAIKLEYPLAGEHDKYKTPGSNSLGSTRESVEKEFGRADEIQFDKTAALNNHFYWEKGIVFSYNSSGKVEKIMVFKISLFDL